MKIAVVGLGWPGQQHIRACQENDVELIAVCDQDPKKLKEFSETYKTVCDYDELLEMDELEAVILAVPHHLHADLTIRALHSGKHVLIEKPMARTTKECQQMIDAAVQHNRVLMVAQDWRYTQWCVAAKNIIENGELGDIQAVRTEWLLNFRDSFPKGNWIYNGKLAGGGAITSLAIHNIDALRFIIGEIKEVYTQQLYTDDWSTNEAENWAMCQFIFENSALGHLFTGYTPFYPPDTGKLFIYGDKGTMFFGPHYGENGLWIRSAERSLEPTADYDLVNIEKLAPGMHGHAQTNQLKHFIESINSGTSPKTDGKQIIHTIELVEMIYRSGSKGVPVSNGE